MLTQDMGFKVHEVERAANSRMAGNGQNYPIVGGGDMAGQRRIGREVVAGRKAYPSNGRRIMERKTSQMAHE